jgi:NADPH2 dehydrogenase
MAPLTRMRSPGGVPREMMVEYYSQRATKGGLIVSEATFIAREAGGYQNAPGIYNQEQITAWRKITDAVHAKGGIIFCQLWAIGHQNAGKMPDVKIVSSGTVRVNDGPVPEQMSIDDIKRYLKHYEHAAKCALEAGFDGCEIHGAHGYLLEQFLNPKINSTRNDIYSGSIENRARFMLEALKVVSDTIGQDRTAIRLSPFSPLGKTFEIDPFENWGFVCEQIVKQCPKMAYISITDPRINEEKNYSSDYFRAIFRNYKGAVSKTRDGECKVNFPEPNSEYPTPFFCAGGYTASDAEPCSDRTGDIIAYGRLFISNPDLVYRLKNGLELNPYDRFTFYTIDETGYTDYPFANESTKKFIPVIKRDPNEVIKKTFDYIEELRSKIMSLRTENAALSKVFGN